MGRIEDDEAFDVETENGVEVEKAEDGDIPGTGEDQADENQSDQDAAAAEKAEADKAEKEKAAAEAAAKKAEAEAAMNAFLSAVSATLTSEGRDVSTGTLSEKDKSDTTKVYAALPGTRAKKAALAFLQEKMQEAMLKDEFGVARTYLEIHQAAQVSAPRETVTVDPTEAHVAQVAALYMAPNLVTVPDDVNENWRTLVKEKASALEDDVVKYRAWLLENADKSADERSEAPKVDQIVVQAAKFATGRGVVTVRKPRAAGAAATTPQVSTTGGYAGPRRNVEVHIRSAFEGKNPGDFLSIAEIAGHTSEEYGDDHPSSGAVAARLFPAKGKCKLDFVRPEEREKKGAVKL